MRLGHWLARGQGGERTYAALYITRCIGNYLLLFLAVEKQTNPDHLVLVQLSYCCIEIPTNIYL